MSKKLPRALTDKQEYQRQQTINKVLHAMEYLMSQGMGISVKNLMEATGLSRSVFAKPHVREAMDDYWQSYEDASRGERRQIEKTSKRKEKAKSDKERIKRLTDENTALKEECELLRGRLFLLMQRLQE